MSDSTFKTPTITFEMHAYAGNDDGEVASTATIETVEATGKDHAKRMAGALAKKVNGPVDLAYAGDAAWPDRYITTTAPDRFATSGYRIERIS